MKDKRVRDPKKDVQIDVNNLGEEIIEHPSLYLYYSDLYADAVEEKERAKHKLDLIYAREELEFRKHWDLHFPEKPTEAAIKGMVIQTRAYKKGQNALIKANRTVNVLKGIVNSFEHRKRALESAVSLQIGGFYADPKTRNPKKGGRRK